MIAEGETIRLRPVVEADHEDIVAIESDLEGQFLADDDPPFRSPAQVRALLSDVLGKEHLRLFAVERTDDGGFVGTCGISVDARNRAGEVGILLRRTAWGTGAGTDAMQALADLAFRHLNLHRVWLTVFATNERAIASYRKVGFVEEGRWREDVWRDGRYVDQVVMAILREEWPAHGTEDAPAPQ